MCKLSKEQLYEQVYQPIKDLKEAFYNSKTPEEWEQLKDHLVELLAKAEDVMDKDFYPKYKEGVVASIKKMYDSKVKYWEKQKQGKPQFTPKKSYLLQDELAEALTEYIKLQTKLMQIQYKNVFEKNCVSE